MKAETTWIVVTDAAHARFYETIGIGQKLVERTKLAMTDDITANRDLERDRPARSFDSHGAGRHSMDAAEPPRRAVKRAFAETVASELDRAAAERLCSRIILAAPPAMLGDLRAALKTETRNIVAAELAKDLVKTPVAELRDRFADVIAF